MAVPSEREIIARLSGELYEYRAGQSYWVIMDSRDDTFKSVSTFPTYEEALESAKSFRYIDGYRILEMILKPNKG